VAFDRTPAPCCEATNNIEHVVGTILDPSDLERTLQGCTVVFHLAALGHLGMARNDPFGCFEVNSLGTARVLDACRRLEIQQVVFTSTCHVYGIPQQLPIIENHVTFPTSIYAASKLAGEAIVRGYTSDFGMSSVIARLSNVFGETITNDTVVGSVLMQTLDQEIITLRNLHSVRDFIYAEDVVEALVRLAAICREPGSQVVNVSSNRGVSIGEMAAMVAKISENLGIGERRVVQSEKVPFELIPKLIVDNGALEGLTGWTPGTSLEHGLRSVLVEQINNRSEGLRHC
jgi:nucleoside-diphosphate-sugar epimerase